MMRDFGWSDAFRGRRASPDGACRKSAWWLYSASSILKVIPVSSVAMTRILKRPTDRL
jgi:hypothetical protein